MKIPVIINNRDLLTWPRAMVERIKQYDGVGEIIIIDNASTYEPLLEWYETHPCTIYILDKNMGHTAPWDANVVRDLDHPYYVVTDSDMGLELTPDDTLLHLLENERKLSLGKIGLGLGIEYVPEASPYYKHVMSYELNRVKNSEIKNEILTDVAIDTTFALYSRQEYFIGGGCTLSPYIGRHYPWEFTIKERDENEEFMYYIKNASYSSSYKAFMKM